MKEQNEVIIDETEAQLELPLLALRDVVVFPYMVMPLFVGREKSVNSLRQAMEKDKKLVLVSQRESELEDPKSKDLFKVGVSANIIQMLNLPDGTVKVLVEGIERVKIHKISNRKSTLFAQISPLETDARDKKGELAVLKAAVLKDFSAYVKNNKRIPDDILPKIEKIDDPARLIDVLSANLIAPLPTKQRLLEEKKLVARYEKLLEAMAVEQDLQDTEARIRERVKEQMEKNGREHYLTEQLRAIRKELEGDEDGELDKLAEKIKTTPFSDEARAKAEKEFKRLQAMPSGSSESAVVRGYLEWLVQLPWKAASKVNKDLAKAQTILDNDHYGLERVKERIVEYLAVQARADKIRGPILCLVGPPGVGKTSLAQSIANATGRDYVRVALGGMHDEAEIRGHRRTYLGSMPGQIMQKMAKVGVRNPLFLLDEIDKMDQGHRGDPSSALLEVLDPEQNKSFYDNYLEVDFDLSDVMFMATSNSMNIQAPLLDRMEVIRLSGYTEDEKMHIASRYLLPKQQKENGLKAGELTLSDDAILAIIRYYTREAGVRNLERELAKICRKAVKNLLLDKKLKAISVTEANINEFLGVARFDFGRKDSQNRVGEVTGLAWTEVGGDLLTIETASVIGTGKFAFTGSLGDVMKESIQAAMVVVRSRAEKWGIASDFYQKRDIHVHVPEGATPKDGPSAGIAMCTALVSSLTGNPVRADVAMTGEITLRGRVLPIGGLKEKLLAALRGGIKTVLIPKENVKDLEEIPENAKAGLEIIVVETIDEVLPVALENPPEGIEILTKTAKPKAKRTKTLQ